MLIILSTKLLTRVKLNIIHKLTYTTSFKVKSSLTCSSSWNVLGMISWSLKSIYWLIFQTVVDDVRWVPISVSVSVWLEFWLELLPFRLEPIFELLLLGRESREWYWLFVLLRWELWEWSWFMMVIVSTARVIWAIVGVISTADWWTTMVVVLMVIYKISSNAVVAARLVTAFDEIQVCVAKLHCWDTFSFEASFGKLFAFHFFVYSWFLSFEYMQIRTHLWTFIEY